MIEPFWKITIVTKQAWAEDALNSLADAAALHLHHTNTPQSETIETIKQKISVMTKALAIISKCEAQSSTDGYSVSLDIVNLGEEKTRLNQEIDTLNVQAAELRPWGTFSNEDLKLLRSNGIYIRLFQCSEKQLEDLPKLSNASIEVISKRRAEVSIAVITTDEHLTLPFKEVLAQDGTLEQTIKEKTNRIKDIQSKIDELGKAANSINAELMKYTNKLAFEEALAGIGKDEELAYILGFCPKNKTSQIEDIAKRQGWAVLIEEPSDDDPVPTLLRQPKWIRAIVPVMNFIGITPGYKEYDTGGLFLVFFTIFFAMLIGDAGYGIIMLACTYLFGKKKNAALFYTLSIATIIWGALTGVWFGSEQLNNAFILKDITIPILNSFSAQSEAVVIRLCFLIGTIHLSIAHAVRAAIKYPALEFLSEIGWVFLMWGTYALAMFIILKEPLSNLELVILYTGIAATILFGQQQKSRFSLKSAFIGIARFPLDLLTIIGGFSDVVSYIRLFAVGLATKEVAAAFNSIAESVGFNSITTTLISIFILAFGHTINLTLGAMAVLVHGVRLNLLEFSRHLDIQWSGIPYKPFKIRRIDL
ncbi:V-type ATPase [Candidatus Magnetoovum chiemensis]|nr:V-type ATPase [Candidatus Magnetoovum chiemensis]